MALIEIRMPTTKPAANSPAPVAERKKVQTTELLRLDEPENQLVMEVIGLIESGMSENAACLKVGMNRSTFRHRALKVGAGDAYARATVALAQDQVSKIEDVIEDMRLGLIDANVGRIELDARKWIASKLMPKQYGEKVQTELTGANGGPLQVAAVDWKNLSSEDLEVMARAARKALGKA